MIKNHFYTTDAERFQTKGPRHVVDGGCHILRARHGHGDSKHTRRFEMEPSRYTARSVRKILGAAVGYSQKHVTNFASKAFKTLVGVPLFVGLSPSQIYTLKMSGTRSVPRLKRKRSIVPPAAGLDAAVVTFCSGGDAKYGPHHQRRRDTDSGV